MPSCGSRSKRLLLFFNVIRKPQDFVVPGDGALIGYAGAGGGVNGCLAEYGNHIFGGFYTGLCCFFAAACAAGRTES